MTVKEKLFACALAALFIVVVLGVYTYLVGSGKADVLPLLLLLGSLVTTAVNLVTGLAGHAAGAGSTVSPQPLLLKPIMPAGLPTSPTAPTSETAAAGTALAPPAVAQ
jgi:hypothetical protein